MTEYTAHIGVLSAELHIPQSNSLKHKRSVVNSIKDRIRSNYNVSVAEIGGNDTWQRTELGICMIGNDKAYINGALEKIASFLGTVRNASLSDHAIEFI